MDRIMANMIAGINESDPHAYRSDFLRFFLLFRFPAFLMSKSSCLLEGLCDG